MISLRPIGSEKVSQFAPNVSGAGTRRTDGSKFGSNVQDHDHCHAKRHDMHEGRGTLEDYGICHLNIPRIAVGYDAC
jgi:hypothetical protein